MDHFPLEQIVERTGSRFAVVVAAAKRAKQIKDGSPPLVETTSHNPLTIALAEIAEGKVTILDAPDVPEQIEATSFDQYFAGRDRAAEETLIYRRPPREAREGADADEGDEEEEEEEDDDLEEDLFDEDEE